MKKAFLFCCILFVALNLSSCWMIQNMRIPRDPNKASKVKMIHKVDGKSYRGRPFYKCNQNPQIGENHHGIKHDRTPIK